MYPVLSLITAVALFPRNADNQSDQILKALYLGIIFRLLASSPHPGKYFPFRVEGCPPSGTYKKLAESQSMQMASVCRNAVQHGIHLPPALHWTVFLWEYVCRACLAEVVMSVSVFVNEMYDADHLFVDPRALLSLLFIPRLLRCTT